MMKTIRAVTFILVVLLVLAFAAPAWPATDVVKLYEQALHELEQWQGVAVELRQENDRLRAELAQTKRDLQEAIALAEEAEADLDACIEEFQAEREAHRTEVAQLEQIIEIQRAALERYAKREKWEYLLFGAAAGGLAGGLLASVIPKP